MKQRMTPYKKADLIRDMVVSISNQIEFNEIYIQECSNYGYFRTGSDQYIGAIASEKHY
jgi:hypothetical protein